MTANQFAALCLEHDIEPAIALENEDLCEALRERDDDLVTHIIETQF